MGVGDLFGRDNEIGESAPAPWWKSGGSIGGGLSIPSSWIIIFILIILGFGGIIAIFMFTPIGTALRGSTFQMQWSISDFFNSFGLRSTLYQLTHPFSVQPTEAQTENPNPQKEYVKSIGESFILNANVVPSKVEVNNVPFTVYLTVNNEGTDTVNRFWVLLEPLASDKYSLNCLGPSFYSASVNGPITKLSCTPENLCIGNCGDFPLGIKDDQLCNPQYTSELENRYLLFSYNNPLVAGGSAALTVSNLYVQDGGLTFSNPVAIPFVAKVFTYYVAASRLPVTFINDNYSTLLYRMGKFKYSEVPATAMAGTAIKINLDVGQQPLSSSTSKTVLLISYENVGKGKLFGQPLLILILPKEFSTCEENYYVCDSNIKNTEIYSKLCDANGIYNETLGGFSHRELEWLCNSINDENKDFHICIANKPLKEFNTYACTMNVHVNMEGAHRQTYYITAFSIYPYVYENRLLVTGYNVG